MNDSPTIKHNIINPIDFGSKKHELGPKIVIIMVGLPARGKSYICKKLKNYLNWTGFRTKLFNVGNKRRLESTKHNYLFFDPLNQNATHKRDQYALDTMEDIISWLKLTGKVAIHDATNSTVGRRKVLLERLALAGAEMNIQVIFIESICTDPEIIQKNIEMKTKSPDYIDMDPVQAKIDFTLRMKNYEKAYQPVTEEEYDDISYVKVINVGKKVIAYNTKGYIASQIVFYLMNIHAKPRTIWLTAHGLSQSINQTSSSNSAGSTPPVVFTQTTHTEIQESFMPIVPNSASTSLSSLSNLYQKNLNSEADSFILSESGKRYAAALGRFLDEQNCLEVENNGNNDTVAYMEVWTSLLRRSIEMAEYLNPNYDYRHSRLLSELYPGEFAKLLASLEDQRYFVERLRPLIIDLERTTCSVLIIAQNIVLRYLCAYFFGDLLPKENNLNSSETPEDVNYDVKSVATPVIETHSSNSKYVSDIKFKEMAISNETPSPTKTDDFIISPSTEPSTQPVPISAKYTTASTSLSSATSQSYPNRLDRRTSIILRAPHTHQAFSAISEIPTHSLIALRTKPFGTQVECWNYNENLQTFVLNNEGSLSFLARKD